MKNAYVILIAVALLAAGCRGANRNTTEDRTTGTLERSADPAGEIAPLEEATLLPSADGVVNPVLVDGSRKVRIRKTAGEKVFADFPTGDYTHLHAAITPVGAGEANLRISMITMPDGSTDGPFGREVDREIPSPGNIRLEIGESMMQGDPWGGDFYLEVKLEKK